MAQRRKPGVSKARNTKLGRIATDTPEEPSYYFCASCGKHFSSMEKSFPMAQSELWAGRKYHLPICRVCIDRMFDHYADVYADEKEAIKRICMAFDMYYNDTIATSVIDKPKARSLMSNYISVLNMHQYKGKTYDTTIDEERRQKEKDDAIITEDKLDEVDKKNKRSLTKSVIERWGVGMFTYDEYCILDDHYNMLKKNNPNIDNNQEIFVKDLCIINMMKMQAAKAKDVETYNKTSEQYSKIFSKAGLKTVEEKDSSMNDTLGVTLAVISQYTPEEFYKNKKLYDDYDELGEYYDRHLRRPMQNIITQTNIRDSEFYVPEEDEVGNNAE